MSSISQALAARALLGLSLPTASSPSPNIPPSSTISSPSPASDRRSPSPVTPLASPNNSLLTLALAKVTSIPIPGSEKKETN